MAINKKLKVVSVSDTEELYDRVEDTLFFNMDSDINLVRQINGEIGLLGTKLQYFPGNKEYLEKWPYVKIKEGYSTNNKEYLPSYVVRIPIIDGFDLVIRYKPFSRPVSGVGRRADAWEFTVVDELNRTQLLINESSRVPIELEGFEGNYNHWRTAFIYDVLYGTPDVVIKEKGRKKYKSIEGRRPRNYAKIKRGSARAIEEFIILGINKQIRKLKRGTVFIMATYYFDDDTKSWGRLLKKDIITRKKSYVMTQDALYESLGNGMCIMLNALDYIEIPITDVISMHHNLRFKISKYESDEVEDILNEYGVFKVDVPPEPIVIKQVKNVPDFVQKTLFARVRPY